MATSAPSSARRTAMAWPSPRPDPVTSATSPFNEKSVSISPLLYPAERLQIRDALSQLSHLIGNNRRRRLIQLPGCAVVRIIIQTLRLQTIERGAKLSGGMQRIAFPPV